MAEHLLCKQGVVGSNPIVSTEKMLVRALAVAMPSVLGTRRAIRVPLPCHGAERSDVRDSSQQAVAPLFVLEGALKMW